jgi:hypothetical protein
VHFNHPDSAWVFANQPEGSQTVQKISKHQDNWFAANQNIVTFDGALSQGRPVNMTAISDNEFLMANASPLMQVSFIKFSELGLNGEVKAQPWWLTAGSQTMKTFVEDPDFPGVSKIKIGPSKCVVALGNVIRAYSFDI